MFEETGTDAFHTDRIRGRLKLETFQGTYAAGTVTLDAANSSPSTTLTGTATLVLGFRPGGFVQFLQPICTGAAQITGVVTAFNAGAGTATITLSALPANGERVFITMLIGRTG
jgi:hypothetical protein